MIKIKVEIKGSLLEDFDKLVEKEKQRILKETLLKLRVATPKDTGKAAKSWRILGKTRISNHLPYVIELNQGSSRQAGPRFIERTLLSTGYYEPNGQMVGKK